MAEIKYLDLNGLKALYGVVDSKILVETDRAKKAEKEISDAIAAMDLDDTAQTGKFITAVHQTDGKVTVERDGVSASMVSATAITGGTDSVAVTGTTVAEQIQSLGQTLKTVEGNAAKYKVVKLTDEEVTALGDANVKEAYKVVSYVGADPGRDGYAQVGETIKIYKDANLKNAELGKGADAQKLILTYILADGSESVVKVDFDAIAFNTEFKNGLHVAENGEISVQIDTASEGFLTVGEGGVKLAGVQAAIDAAVAGKNVEAEGDDYVGATASNNKVTVASNVRLLTVTTTSGANSTITGVEKSLVDGKEVADKVAAFTNARIGEEIAKLDATVGETTVVDGNHVAVQVVEADGKITAVNVKEDDIASKKALDAEVTRATDAEAKALADAKAYTDGQFTSRTTLAGYGITDAKIDGQTITLGTETLTFTAWTPQEIRDAANK